MNREKTVVAYAGKIKFLRYGFYKGKKGFALWVHAKSKAKMKARVRELTSRRTINDHKKWKKVDLKRCVVGWVNYYKLADMGTYLQSVDEWMRRRIRMVFWKKRKRVRRRWRNLLKLGISNANAGILAKLQKGILADGRQLNTTNSPQG
ncbi:MAG: group II intron maturase-specific domain-containing protein [Eubacteriaceae bacterium]|nr:group II intron maturase-specific domain-containing protein [Eubacteriaceae bacterium]